MELDKLETLLERYDAAETTLVEEEQIRAYFEQEHVPEHLKSYKLMFQYVAQAKEERYEKALPVQPKKSLNYRWLSIAAVAVLMLGIYLQVDQLNQKTTLDDLSQDELMAFNRTVEVFSLVSSKFNKGTDNLEVIGLVSSKLNEGAENLTHLKEFNKTTNKIIKSK